MYAANQHHLALRQDSDRVKLAKMLMKLFELWKLDTATQLALMSLSPTSRAMLSRYRQGLTPLPYTQDLLDRAGWLLAIHQALRSLYPQDADRCYAWVNLRHQMLDNLTPVEYMRYHGLIGIAKVARYLQLQLVT
jgi:hypothetical protein